MQLHGKMHTMSGEKLQNIIMIIASIYGNPNIFQVA